MVGLPLCAAIGCVGAGPIVATQTESSGDGDPTTQTTGDPTTGDGEPDDTTDTDSDSETGLTCGEVSFEPAYTPPNVMLVLDASGSMVASSWDHDLDAQTPDVTRWRSLHDVVTSVLAPFGPTTLAGVQRFPSADACPDATLQSPNCDSADACIVGAAPEVGAALDNGAAILAALPGPDADSVEIVGATPASAAIRSTVEHLTSLGGDNPSYILLITDGAANCTPGLQVPALLEDYDETLPTTVEAAYQDDGITTYVVGVDIVDALVGVGVDGLPEANPFARLNDVAVAGGAPKNGGVDAEKFFNATNQGELLTAVSTILDAITECTIDLELAEFGPPDRPQVDYVEFTVDGQVIPGPLSAEECATMDGWAWSVEHTEVILCGVYCGQFERGEGAFEGAYGCPPNP